MTTNINGTNQSIVSNIQYRGDAVHGSTNVAGAGRAGATSQMLSCTYGNELQDTRTYDLQGRLLNQLLGNATVTFPDNSITLIAPNGNSLTYRTDNTHAYTSLVH